MAKTVYGQQSSIKVKQSWVDNESELENEMITEFCLLLGTYALGNTLKDFAHAGMIMDCMLEMVKAFNVPGFWYILREGPFDEARPNRAFRRFMTDLFIYNCVSPPRDLDHVGNELAVKIIQGFLNISIEGIIPLPNNAPWLENKCRYHRHSKTGGQCYKAQSLDKEEDSDEHENENGDDNEDESDDEDEHEDDNEEEIEVRLERN